MGLLAVLLAGWFAWPALFGEFTEGFQAQTALGAHALAASRPGLADALYPFDGRFFLLTRLGTGLLLLALHRLAGFDTLLSFRVINVVSLVVLVAALLALLRRVHRVGPALGLLCCVLYPTVFESAWLPNDDLPSAALITVATLVFLAGPTLWRALATGLLLGCAVLLRTDALLVAPAFAVILLTDLRSWGRRAACAAVAIVCVLLVPIVAYRLCGLSYPDTFAAAAEALRLWDRPPTALLNDARTLLRNVTLLGAVAWLLGLAAFWRAGLRRDLALATVMPVLYVAAYRSQLVEGRYLLPLAPFVLPALAVGLRSLPTLPRVARLGASAALALGLALFVLPPPAALPKGLTGDPDGPRLVLGRLWNPWAQLWWEAQLRDGRTAIAAGLDAVLAAPDSTLVTAEWTADRQAELMLSERGFAPSSEPLPPACQSIAELRQRGATTVLLIRLHVPFVAASNVALTWQRLGEPCLRQAHPALARLLFVRGTSLDQRLTAIDPPGLLLSSSTTPNPPIARTLRTQMSGLTVALLSPDELAGVLGPMPAATEMVAALRTLSERSESLR